MHLRVETSQSVVTGELTPGETVEIPIKHGEGQFVARPEDLARIEDEGWWCSATARPAGVADDAHNPNGATREHRRACATTRATWWA